MGDALCCPEGVNMNQLASSLWGFSSPLPYCCPVWFSVSLASSSPCQKMVSLPPHCKHPLPSWLWAGIPPSCFLLTLASLLTRESGQMIRGDMNLCFFLHHNCLSHWKFCHSLIGLDQRHQLSLYHFPQVFTEMRWESESVVQGLVCPGAPRVCVHMSAPRPREWEKDSNFLYLPCVSW